MLTRLCALVLTLLVSAAAIAQTQELPTIPADPLAALNFLVGTWSAKLNTSGGTAKAEATGTYTFARDLAGHALQRTESADTCKGPAGFNCQHHAQLTIFADPNGQAAHHATLFALYIDNEGHVIYYAITTPDPHTAVFNSVGTPSAPKFRLTYHLEGDGPKAVMSGRFQIAAPGSEDFRTYLEWTGSKL